MEFGYELAHAFSGPIESLDARDLEMKAEHQGDGALLSRKMSPGVIEKLRFLGRIITQNSGHKLSFRHRLFISFVGGLFDTTKRLVGIEVISIFICPRPFVRI